MRAKSSEARDNQQSILQWSLAASGVVMAGAMTGFARDKPTPEFELAVAIALTAVVPLILVAAFAFWLSEVARMLRAARYLREREDSLIRAKLSANLGRAAGPVGTLYMFDNYPLVWENLLLVRGWRGQADLGPFAVTAIYVSLTTLSASAGIYIVSSLGTIPRTVERCLYAAGGMLIALALGLAIWGFLSSYRERRKLPAAYAGNGQAVLQPSVPSQTQSSRSSNLEVRAEKSRE